MKQKLKHYLKLGILLFGIPLVIFSCAKEETIIEDLQSTNNGDALNITITTLEHLTAANTNITSRLSKFLNKELTQNRTESNTYGFYIDEDKVQITHKENYSTYTFIAIRDEEQEGILENYMLKENNDGTYQQYLITFEYTIDENDNILYNTDYLEMYIIDDPSLIASRTTCFPELIDIAFELVCYNHRCKGARANGQHEAGNSSCECVSEPGPDCIPAGFTCDYEHVFIMTECGGGDPSSDNPNDTDDGPEGPQTGGGPTGTNPDPTDEENDDQEDDQEEPIEIIPLENFVNFRDNCNELQKLSQTDELSANINPTVTQLKNLTAEDNEYSISYRKNINGGEESNFPDSDGILEGDSQTGSSINYGAVWFGGIHTHPKGTIQMFSWLDISRLKLVYDNLHADFNKEDVFIMIVNDNGTVYAAKIDDITKLSEELQNDLDNAKGNTIDKKEENLTDKLSRKYRKGDNIERTFLKNFLDYGISLFKANDENLSNWSKLKLEEPASNNSDVITKPCN